MVEAGVDIDKALGLVYDHPVGPLRRMDLMALDIQMDVTIYLHGTLGSQVFRPPELLERMVAEGKLGKKSGEGFFSWDQDGRSVER